MRILLTLLLLACSVPSIAQSAEEPAEPVAEAAAVEAPSGSETAPAVTEEAEEAVEEAEQPAPVKPTPKLKKKQRVAPDLSALTPEEQALYRQGPMDNDKLLAGGLLGTFLGFGVGHIPYGMWGKRGWIFTIGETAALTAFIIGAVNTIEDCTIYANGSRRCTDSGDNDSLLILGAASYFVLRIWEIIDVWTIPAFHNQEIRDLDRKLSENEAGLRWSVSPVAYRPRGETKTIPGLQFRVLF